MHLTLLITWLFLAFSGSHATIRTWSAGGAGYWNTGANWSGSAVPGSGDTARFNGTSVQRCSIDVAVNVNRIEITSAYTGATAAIYQKATFTITVGAGGYDQSAGTFNGGSNKFDVDGSFFLRAGTFVSTTDTLEVGLPNVTANDTIYKVVTSAATFTHNSGVLTFNAYGATTGTATKYINVNTKLNLNHVVYFNSSGSGSKVKYFLTSTDTLVINGNVYINGVTASGTELDSGTNELKGNLISGNGTIAPDAASYRRANGTALLITGSGNQIYADSVNALSRSAYLGHVTINKSSTSKVTVPAGTCMRLSGGPTGAGGQKLTVTSGALEILGHVLQIRDSLIINGGTVVIRDTAGLDPGPVYIGSSGGLVMKAHGSAFFRPKSTVQNEGFLYINGFGGSSGDADSIKIHSNAAQKLWWGAGNTYLIDVRVVDTRDSTGTIKVRSCRDSLNNTGVVFSTIDTVRYSIGTNTGTIYGTGTATSDRSTTVSFAGGASLPTNIGEGDMLIFDVNASTAMGADTCIIRSRDNATQVTVQFPPVYSYSGEDYAIKRRFNNIQSWDDASQYNLTSTGILGQNVVWKGICYNDGEFTGQVKIDSGFAYDAIRADYTDATHFKWLTVASTQRHNGSAGTGVVVNAYGDPSNVFSVVDSHTVVEWMEIKNHLGVMSDGAALASYAKYITYRNNLIYNTPAYNRLGDAIGFHVGNGAQQDRVFNNIIFGKRRGIATNYATGTDIGHLFYNNTVFNCDSGILSYNASTIPDTITNNLSVGNSVNYQFYGYTPIVSYNAGESGNMPAVGSNNVTVTSAFATFQDTTKGSPNLHIKTGANSKDAGTSLSGNFTLDVDNEARPNGAAWDIGADEWYSGGSLLSLGIHAQGQVGNALTSLGAITGARLFRFKLDYHEASRTVTQLVFSLTGVTGVVNGDFTNVKIYVDDNGNGLVDGSEATTVGGAGTVSVAGSTITFSTSFDVTAVTHYIFVADLANLWYTDGFTLALTTANITTSASKDGTCAGVTHSNITINARSIGTTASSLFTGTTNTSTNGTKDTLTTSGSFPTNIGEGDSIRFTGSGQTGFILARVSATKIALISALASSETNQTINIYRRYNTLSAWETDRQGNLVTRNAVEKGVCYDDGDLTAGVVIDGSTTDSSHYVWLTAASGQRHNGTAAQGVTVTSDIDLLDAYTIVEWLDISTDNTNDINENSVTIRNCLIHGTGSGIGINIPYIYYYHFCKLYNNIIYQKSDGIRNVGGSGGNFHNLIFNNIVYKCTNGIKDTGNWMFWDTLKNNISVGNTTNWLLSGSEIADYNAGELGNMPNTGTHNTSTTAYESFVDTTTASRNLHLRRNSVCVDAGTNLSAHFTKDIDDTTTRPLGSAWDLGADERLFSTDTSQWYVDYRNGTDASGKGRTLATPAKNIEWMYDQLPDIFADSVYVINLLPGKHPAADQIQLDANGPYFVPRSPFIIRSYYPDLDSMAMVGAATGSNGEGTFTPTVQNIVFDRIMIRGSAAVTGKAGIAYYSGSSPNNITVKNCVFLFDSIGGVDSYGLAQGVYLETSDSLKVYNNIFIGRVGANDWSRGDGVVSTGKGCRIINNTFYKVSYAWSMTNDAGAVGTLFANNMFDSLYYAVYNNTATTYNFKFINNAFYNMQPPTPYVYTGGSTYNVSLLSAKHFPATAPILSYDYRLREFGKPAKGNSIVDAGYDTTDVPARDFYGLDSVVRRDVGACEYNNKKDLFYADTVHLFVDYDKADNTGNGRTIATAKRHVDSAYALIPSTADSTYVINLLPSASAYQGASTSRSLSIDGSLKTFPSWTKSLAVQSYYTNKDSFATLGNASSVLGLIKFTNTVRYIHLKRMRFIKLDAGTSGDAIAFQKLSAGQVFRSIKISECVFDTANGGKWNDYIMGYNTEFMDSIDIYNCYFGGNGTAGNRALQEIYTDSSATYGVRLVNNTFNSTQAVLYNCHGAGLTHFKLLNNVIINSGVFVVTSGGHLANSYANWNCYHTASSITSGSSVQGTDTLVRDPKLQSVTWSNSAFGKLSDDSPVIGFGKDSVEFVEGKIHYVTPRYDLFAIKRLPRIDMGCAQYDPSSIAGKRIFQEGVHGGDYGAAEDAQMYGFDATYKTYNYGGKVSMEVRGGSPFKSLIRYPSFSGKVSSLQVPSNAHVDSAFLYLYCTQGASGDAEVYRVTRSWTEGTADGATQSGSVTWNAAKSGTANWGTEGADNLNDREPVSVATNAAIGTNSWERWDVSPLVQDWVSGVTNYGLLLSDQNSDMNMAAKFHTSDYTTDKTLRPRLVVYYDEDTVTVIHQAGTVTNTEVDDTYLSEASAANNYGAATGLRLQTGASARMFPLINFTRLKGSSGSNQIPANATVKSAELTLFRSDADAGLDVDESYAHRVTNIWEEGVQSGSSGSASWTGRYQSLNWASGGALGSTDHDPAAPSAGNSTGATIGQGIVWKADTAAVDWAGGAKNNGVLVKTTGTIATAIDFYSSEGTGSVSAFYNPKFKATYYGTGGNEGNTPWHTPTRPLLKLYTALSGPSTTVSFNQGGTGGTTDDAFVNVGLNTTNWGGTDSLKLKVLGDASCRKILISFTDFVGSTGGRVPSSVIIDTAYIQLVEENSTLGANIVVDIYRVNESWTEGTGTGVPAGASAVTSKYRVHTSASWSNDSILTPTSATLIYQNVTLTRVAGNGGVNDTVYIPAKYLVQTWVNGTANNGILIVKKTSSDGTAINSFFSSEEAVATSCPRLIVKYYKPEQIEVQNVGRYATENSNFASADSLKNQFFLSFHTRTDSTDGLFNQFKTGATSPGQRIKTSYDLLPTGLRRYSPYNVVRNSGTGDSAFYGESVTAGSITWSVVESTTTRMRYRISGRTVVDGGANPRNAVVATEITVYPTGQVFVWDSSYTAISAGTYHHAVIFAQRSGTGTVATDGAVGYGGVYSTAAGNQTLHDFAAGFLTYKAAALGTPYTTATSIGGQSGFYLKGAESNFNGTAAAYRQNFLFDFSTDDANHADTLKRLYEDKRYPASMAGFRTGSKKTNASGDLDADGFNEKEGCYELTADNGEAYFWFNSTSPRPRYYPVFKLNGYTYNAAPSAVYLITPDETIIDTLDASKGDVNISFNDAGDYVVFQLNRHIDAACVIYVGPRNTLAVEMGAFWGSADSGVCKLGWRTESEKDNAGFRLLRRIVRPGNSKLATRNAKPENDFQVVKSYEWDDHLRGQLTKALRTEYGVEDNTVKLGETYEYALESVDLSGNTKLDGRRVVLTVDQTFPFALGQNYPNPFNPSTTIRYQVPGRFSGRELPLVHLRVFNIRGQLIRDLVSTRQRPSRYAVLWNGKANNGRYAASGVYFYRLEVGESYRKVRKMIVVK